MLRVWKRWCGRLGTGIPTYVWRRLGRKPIGFGRRTAWRPKKAGYTAGEDSRGVPYAISMCKMTRSGPWRTPGEFNWMQAAEQEARPEWGHDRPQSAVTRGVAVDDRPVVRRGGGTTRRGWIRGRRSCRSRSDRWRGRRARRGQAGCGSRLPRRRGSMPGSGISQRLPVSKCRMSSFRAATAFRMCGFGCTDQRPDVRLAQ